MDFAEHPVRDKTLLHPTTCHECKSRDPLRSHLAGFLMAGNVGHWFKTLKGLTPYEYLCQAEAKELDRFNLDPLHQIPERNSRLSLWSLPLPEPSGGVLARFW